MGILLGMSSMEARMTGCLAQEDTPTQTSAAMLSSALLLLVGAFLGGAARPCELHGCCACMSLESLACGAGRGALGSDQVYSARHRSL